jgi:hypothetical protein
MSTRTGRSNSVAKLTSLLGAVVLSASADGLGAQYYCPATAVKANTFVIPRYDGAGSVSFRPWTYRYISYGNFYTPVPVAKANQYGRSWKWQNAYIGVERCDSYQNPNGTVIHIVDFDENNVQGYALAISSLCDDDDGWGGELKVAQTRPKARKQSVSASCIGDGGSPLDPHVSQPGGGTATCIPPGCYSVYVDGSYVGSACFDVQLCIRV